MARILIVYYSMYGNCYRMAQTVASGVAEVAGAQADVKTVPELIPPEVIAANPGMKAAKELQKDVPVATTDELGSYDGIIVGTPTRFGNMIAQMRNFWDRTSNLWLSGKLVGKPAGVFCSTATIHGGQETTLISTIFTFLHHGMVVVGVPYTVPQLITTNQGGTPYGPSHTAGTDASWPLTDDEIAICKALGNRVAGIATKLAK